jgi:hypothetical protein
MDISEIAKQGILGIIAVYFIYKDAQNQKEYVRIISLYAENSTKSVEALEKAASAMERSNQLHAVTNERLPQ